MADEEEPEQIRILKQMLALAQRQTELSEKRTRMSEERTSMSAERSKMSAERSKMSGDRSRMSEDRSRMSEERTRMSAERSKMSAERSKMSEDRSRMSADRSELSSERSYMNAERTLANWTRTALELMILGIAMDRFGLLFRRLPITHGRLSPNTLSTWGGAALIAFAVFMAITTGIRYIAYAFDFQRKHRPPKYHGPYLAPFFSLLVALFGIGLLIILLVLGM
ncbi:MAG: DUF202 domain-containing protein [Gammaproteobacteria bacterium]